MTGHLSDTYPDEYLSVAVDKILYHDMRRLLVVDREDAHRLVIYLSRRPILKACQRRLQQEREFEHSWLSHWLHRSQHESKPPSV